MYKSTGLLGNLPEFPVGFLKWSFKLWVLSQLCLFLALSSCCMGPGPAFCFYLRCQIFIGQIWKWYSALSWCLLRLQLCTNQGNLQGFVAVFGSYKAVNEYTIALCQSKLLLSWSVLSACFPLSCVIAHSLCCLCVSPVPLSLLWRLSLQKRDSADGCLSCCDCHL